MTERIDKYTATAKKSEIYSDFFTNFDVHPNTDQLVRVTNEEAVKRSIRSLLLTDKYERLLNPSIGSNIRRMLFEPISAHTTLELQKHITNTIENHEPRAKILTLEVQPSPDQNSYFINLVFYITSSAQPIPLTLSLKRAR